MIELAEQDRLGDHRPRRPAPPALRRLLAEILAGERWLDALEPLGKLDPPALAAVDREPHG